MKRRTIITSLLTLMVAGGLVGQVALGGGIASAVLQEQNDVGVQFTLDPAIGVSLSSGTLKVERLSPGTSANSDEIDVVVSTNNVSGYTLTATVGDATHAYRDLRNVVNGTTYKITSIAFNNVGVNSLGLDGENNGTWGYSLDGGTTYYGLPLYNDGGSIATLSTANEMPTGGVAKVPFLIGASAGSMQASGDYTNVINFMAVANPMTENSGS